MPSTSAPAQTATHSPAGGDSRSTYVGVEVVGSGTGQACHGARTGYRARMPTREGDLPFDRLVAELVDDQLRANPVLGSALGVTEHDGDLPDLSADGIAARERVEDDWADWRRTPDPYAGSALSGVFGLLQNRLRPEGELAEAVAARLRGTPALLEACRENLDPALASPVLLRRSLGQIGAGVAYSRSVSGEFGGDLTAE